MKIIIDECVPHIVKKRLPERRIKTVREIGWAGVKNGELLKFVEKEFDVLLLPTKIPAGAALAVDRGKFAEYISEKIERRQFQVEIALEDWSKWLFETALFDELKAAA